MEKKKSTYDKNNFEKRNPDKKSTGKRELEKKSSDKKSYPKREPEKTSFAKKTPVYEYPKRVLAEITKTVEPSESQEESFVSKKNMDKKSEIKIYGVNACYAAFETRPQDILRVYIEPNKVKHFAKLLKVCAEKKIAYKLIPQDELNKVTETTHNEGICLLVKRKEVINFKKFLGRLTPEDKYSCVVALEHVQNPHNIGAVLRVCANFAVDAMLLHEPQIAQSGAVYRTAEGGAEFVDILETGELLKAVEEFKNQGYKVYGTTSHSGNSLVKSKFSHKCVILFGSESEGLSPSLSKICDEMIFIPQTGRVESLNVACAASVVLYEYYKNIPHEQPVAKKSYTPSPVKSVRSVK